MERFKKIEEKRLMNDIIKKSQAPEPVGSYPHARRVGNLLFLSGVGPRKKDTNIIPGVMMDGQGNPIGHDIELQCHSVFKNIKIILEEAGSHWKNIVDVTVFLINMKRDFETYNRVYSEYFINNQPCRTTVEITSLPTPIAIELKCIATINQEA
jgi:2-aminomuconate deaminase